MDHKPLIIANWKMNPTTQKEAEHLFGSVEKEVRKIKEAEIVICPPFVWLSILGASARGGLAFGSQDCFWEEKGAYTSQVSPLMLKNLGCRYVIIGHSERRKYFQENDEIINRKIKTALKTRLRPILCLGEEVRDTFDSQGQPLNEMSLKVGEQLEKDLMGISAAKIREIVIAYEPIWAISTNNGIDCSPDEAMKAALFIRKTLAKFYNRSIADKVKIIYGGSVDSQNVNDYVKGAGTDGVLVGNASLNASEFVKIIEEVVT